MGSQNTPCKCKWLSSLNAFHWKGTNDIAYNEWYPDHLMIRHLSFNETTLGDSSFPTSSNFEECASLILEALHV